MKKAIFILIIFLSFLKMNGQSINWISSGAGDTYIINNGEVEIGYSVVPDGTDTYLTGLVTGAKTKVQDTIIQNGDFCFISKYDEVGNLKWLRQLDWWGRTDAVVNSKNEVLVTGRDWYDAYIVKYDRSGNLLWEKELLKYTSRLRPLSISIDSKDAIYISGSFFSFGDELLVEDSLIQDLRGYYHGFVLKYNNIGDFQWIRITDGGEHCGISDIKIDNNDNAIIIGDYSTEPGDSMSIGSFYFKSIPEYTEFWMPPTQDVIVAKYTSKGDLLWAKTMGGQRDDWGNKLSINSLNEIIITGTYTDSANIDDKRIISKGSYDIFICKLNPEGEAIWAKTSGGPSGVISSCVEAGRSVETDYEDNIYISGSILRAAVFGEGENEVAIQDSQQALQSGFIAKYSTDGDLIWVNAMTENESTIEDIHINKSDLLITGGFTPEVSFMNVRIPASYNSIPNFFISSISTYPTFTQKIVSKPSLKLFPNPTTGKIKINSVSIENILRIEIYNSKGEIVASESISITDAEIDLSHLYDGLYIIRILTSEGFSQHKVIKSN